MDYNIISDNYDKYINTCIETILNKHFTIDEISLSRNYILASDIEDDEFITLIKKHRLEMINNKIEHTKRVVKNIISMSEKMNLSVDFTKIVKTTALLHDIGRFAQVLFSDTFIDSYAFKDKEFHNHAEFGAKILNDGEFVNLGGDLKHLPVVYLAVLHHQDQYLKGYLASKINDSFNNLDVEDLLSGSLDLNESEKLIVALLTQMVKDVDMLDIIYQRLTGDIPLEREWILKKNKNGLDNLALAWGVSVDDILEYNKISKKDTLLNDEIKIPVIKIPDEKFFVADDIKRAIYNGDDIDLKTLQSRDDFTFITAHWWVLYHFLKNISFTSNLMVLQETNLLDKLYEKFPPRFKPHMKEIIEYAKEVLLKETIENSDNLIYVRRKAY